MADPSTPRGSAARSGALIFAALSVLLAATGGWLVWRLLSAGGYDREPLHAVVIAARPVGAGHPLRAEDLQVKMFPESSVPVGAFTEIEPLIKPTAAVPTSPLVIGEPILKARLAAPDAGPGLSALVAKESRAVMVQIDRAMAVARLLYPGAHVDVLVTLEDKLRGVVMTRTLLEDVRVLATGTYADVDAVRRGADAAKPTGESEAVVTLEVSPADAEKLALSARQGKLDLTLRNATDRSHTPTLGVAVSELVQPLTPEGEPVPVPGRPPEPTPKRRSSSSAAGGPPQVRTFPRQPGVDQNPSRSNTIEVVRVPTQSR